MSFIPQFWHFGECQLPYPWRHYGAEWDLRERLPFESRSGSFIYADYVIQKLPFSYGYRFLRECCRTLKPGGVLRLSFPDVTKFTKRHVDAYSYYLAKRGIKANTLPEVYNSVLADWGHKSCWTKSMVTPALLAAGFEKVWFPKYGKSLRRELNDIDTRHLVGGDIKMAALETTIVEATR